MSLGGGPKSWGKVSIQQRLRNSVSLEKEILNKNQDTIYQNQVPQALKEDLQLQTICSFKRV